MAEGDHPFFFYYAMHLVHKPTLRTPDTTPGTKNIDKLYDDNIRYMDKQLGALVDYLEKLGLRKHVNRLHRRQRNRRRLSLAGPRPHGQRLERKHVGGRLRVPFIVSWPAVTPKGKVLDDIVSFADPHATFAEIAGVKPTEGFKTDGQSFLAQLRGEPGTPRKWAYVQLDGHWYVREPGFKLNEAGNLFDMSDAPFVEKPVSPEEDTPKSKAARQRLAAALEELNPAGGKTDHPAGGQGNRRIVRGSPTAVGPWKSGDTLPSPQAPAIGGKALEITAEIEPTGTEGVVVSQGAGSRGYAIYLTQGKLAFAVRENKNLTAIVAKEPLGKGHFTVKATLHRGRRDRPLRQQ